MRYREIVTELFDRPGSVYWNVKSKNLWDGSFAVGRSKFDIEIYHCGDSRWQVTFEDVVKGLGNTGLHGAGSIGVMSEIVAALSQFLQEMKPDRIFFSGSKSYGKDSMYQKMLQNLKPRFARLGYESNETDKEAKAMFYLDRVAPS